MLFLATTKNSKCHKILFAYAKCYKLIINHFGNTLYAIKIIIF